MKLAVVLLLCSVAIAVKQEWSDVRREEVTDTSYVPQREYHYLYDGQISTGIPRGSDQRGTTRIQSLVSFIFQRNGKTVLMQMKKIRFGSSNGELQDPKEVQKFQLFEEKELDQEQEEILKRPLRFKYVNGLISELEFDQMDKPWSKNIKRAVLNMLQVDMKRYVPLKEVEGEGWEEERGENRGENRDSRFKHERTVEGDCETSYTFVVPETTRNVFNVTKSINFEKCRERVDIRYNFRFGEVCKSCEDQFDDEEHATKTSTVYTYGIVGTKDRFLVQRSEVRSQYIYSPLSKEDNVLTSYVVGRIVLYKVKEGESRVELPETERKESLLYRPEREIMIERFVMNGDEELRNDHPFRDVKNKVEVVGNTIRRMMKSMVDSEMGIETEATEQMSRLVQVLRMCSKDELERIHEQFFQRSEQFDDKTTLKVREVLIDAYSLAGTKNTIELLVEKIEDHKILPLKAWNALQNLATLKVTSEKQIDIVLRLCKSEVCERNPILKQTCLLSTGSMINALCGITKDRLAIEQKEEKKCPRQLKEKYVEELMNLFRESRTRYEKILVLKTLANAGLDVSVQHIERIIVNRQLDRIIRTQAIDSLRRLRSVMPRKIQRILMPIFKSTHEPVELRLNALAQIMYTLPERAILDQIADTLFKEQSRQVKGFVYSMLQTFSKSRNPCEKKMVEDLRTSLRLLRVHISKWSDSKFVHWPLYSNEHKTGMTVDLATIFHNEGLLPRELMMNLDTIFGGQWRKYVAQLGFVQYNGEQLLETLLKITKEKMEDTGSVRPQQVLSELYKKLNLRDRRERNTPFAMLFVRRNDQDFAVLPFDLETLPQEYHIFHEGKLNLARLQHIFSHPIRIHNHWAHYVYDSSRTIPTSLGLPLIISGEVPTLTGWEGEVKVEMEPERSEVLRKVTLHVRIHPKIAIVHVTKMRTWNPVVNSGFKAVQLGKFHFPIDVSMEVNLEKNFEIKYTFKVPQQKKQILSLQSRLMTVTSFSPNNAKAYIEPKVKTVHLEKEPQMLKSIETSFGEKFFGINFDVRGHYYQHSESMVKGLLFNENVLEVNMIPRSNAPREVVTKFKFDAVEEVNMEKPKLEGIYQEWEGDDYETEKWEGERELYDDELPEEDRVVRKERKGRSEHERRREFSEYVNDYKEKKGYKLRMRVHVETIGTNVERTGELEMWTACDSGLQFCKLNLKGSRSPIFEHENGKWTIDMKVESLYPLAVRSLSELKERKHREFQAKIDCKWGEGEKQTINVKIQGEQCNEQQRILNNVLENVNKPVERYNEILLASQLNQYKVVADYRLTKGFKEYLYKMFQWTISRNLLNTETKQFNENKENKLYVKLTIDPRSHQHVSMLVQTPLQTVQFWKIHVPLKLAPFMVNIHKQTTPVRSLRHFAEQVTYEDRAECKVNSKKVDTFDDVTLKVPITTCYSVLAKDCTSEEPKFVVMLKKIIKGEEEKKMKIIDEDRTIEIERKEGELKVKVNGHVINDEERLLEYKINLKDDMVIIELEDVLVRFDGYTVSMKLSGLFKNKVCGICGHYDDEQSNELRKSDNEWTDDVKEFHSSYFTRDEECEIDEEVVNERKNYALSVDEFTDELNDEEKPIKKPIMKTRVIEYNHEICFSMKPVPECPKDMYENDEKSVDKKISFTCLRRSHHETTKLTRRARTHVLNMEDYKPSFVETISIPEECLPF